MADLIDKVRVSNLRAILTYVLLLAAGGCLLFLAAQKSWWGDNNPVQTVIQDLGSLTVASVAIGFLLDFFGRRSLMEELTTKIGLSANVVHSGIVDYRQDYLNVDWDDLFRKTGSLTVFFTYGQTWRNYNLNRLQALAAKTNASIRFVLPDPENQSVLIQLSERFSCTSDDIRSNIQKSIQELREIQGSGNVTIHLVPFAPLYAAYQFDHTIVLTIYSHVKRRQSVPTIIVEEGRLYDFLCQDMKDLVQSGRTAT